MLNQQADFNPLTLGGRELNPQCKGVRGTLYASVFEANDSHFMFSFDGALIFLRVRATLTSYYQ